MAIPQLKQVPQDADLETVALGLNKLIQELDWLFGGAIDFKNIKALGIVTKNLKAGAVTAEKISVDQLSAISADMGTLTAGEIIGGYIRANTLLEVVTEAKVGKRITVGFGTSAEKEIYLGLAYWVSDSNGLLHRSPLGHTISSTLGPIRAESSAGAIPDIVSAILNLQSQVSNLNARVSALESKPGP